MEMKAFAFVEVLNSLMKERGVSAKVVCQATGIPQSTLSEWMSGSRGPILGDPLLRLARFFGVSLEYLCTGKHPEAELVQDILESAETRFSTIHRGVYRINVERYVPPAPGKKSRDASS
jgi:transcriptional regulator with XRE-family HTH domain